MKWLTLAALLLSTPCHAALALMEGVNATRNTMKADVTNGRVVIATTSYTGGISNVGLFVASNVVVGTLANKNAVVAYATGSVSVGILSVSLANGANSTDASIYNSVSNIGTTQRWIADNSDNTNGASNASLQLQTGGASSGDPFIQFNNRVNNWVLGMDNSDSDKFKLSNGVSLGTNDYFAVDSSGNVGIGTASPATGLELDVSTQSLPATSGNADSGAIFRIKGNDDSVIDFGFATDKYWIQATNRNDLSIHRSLLFNPNGGNVGIGTTGPATKLQVNNGTASIYQPAKQTLGLISQLHLMAFGMGSTNDLGQIAFGYDNALSYAPGVIGSIVTNQSGNTAVDLIFATRNATTDTAPSERMRITAGGKVGVGMSPSYTVDVAGDVNVTGSFLVNGTAVGVAAVSSVTYIPSGSSTQSTFNLAYATVTLTLNGGYDLEVTVNCAATAVTDCSLGWSVLYDGSNSKFGLGSATGVAWQNSTNTNFHQNISATFQVKASEITSGSHSFAFSPAVCAGNTITWPATQGSQQSSCRFGVKEIH